MQLLQQPYRAIASALITLLVSGLKPHHMRKIHVSIEITNREKRQPTKSVIWTVQHSVITCLIYISYWVWTEEQVCIFLHSKVRYNLTLLAFFQCLYGKYAVGNSTFSVVKIIEKHNTSLDHKRLRWCILLLWFARRICKRIHMPKFHLPALKPLPFLTWFPQLCCHNCCRNRINSLQCLATTDSDELVKQNEA